MKKEMLINVLQPEECRIAILEDGVLEELYVERTSQESYVGNVYKGRIVNIEPSIQAAFVDFGIGRNGFLHVSDVDPAYYRHIEPRRERGDRDRDRGDKGDRGRGGRGDRGDRGRRGGRGERDRERPRRIPDIEDETESMPEPEPLREGEDIYAGLAEAVPPPEPPAEAEAVADVEQASLFESEETVVEPDAEAEPSAEGESAEAKPRRRARRRRRSGSKEAPAESAAPDAEAQEPAAPERGEGDVVPPGPAARHEADA